MSIRVKIIVAVSVLASYMFIGGMNMARYDRLHPQSDCAPFVADRWDYSDCMDQNNTGPSKFFAGVGWPFYILFSLGIELGENHE